MNSIFTSPAEDNGANLNAESRFVHVRALANDERSPNDAFDRLERKLIGDSHRMHELRRSIRMVASSGETVLITGESGTGKELIARAVHDLSRRRGVRCCQLRGSQ
jgi:transcriptional regulator with GAF, ATPase, and Fis domain